MPFRVIGAAWAFVLLLPFDATAQGSKRSDDLLIRATQLRASGQLDEALVRISMALSNCMELHKKRTPGDRLRIERQPTKLMGPSASTGKVFVSFAVDAQGAMQQIRVLEAPSPQHAMYAIAMVALGRATPASVTATDTTLFPVRKCAVVDFSPPNLLMPSMPTG